MSGIPTTETLAVAPLRIGDVMLISLIESGVGAEGVTFGATGTEGDGIAVEGDGSVGDDDIVSPVK